MRATVGGTWRAATTGVVVAVVGGATAGCATCKPPGTIRPCRAHDVTVQSAFVVPQPDGDEVFVRLFRAGPAKRLVCFLNGVPDVRLRDDEGHWHKVPSSVRTQAATNGPAWTGRFTDDLVGVVTVASGPAAAGAPVHRYTAARITLPNSGETVDATGFRLTVRSRSVVVSRFEADSQDR